jgi:hypothetical protein
MSCAASLLAELRRVQCVVCWILFATAMRLDNSAEFNADKSISAWYAPRQVQRGNLSQKKSSSSADRPTVDLYAVKPHACNCLLNELTTNKATASQLSRRSDEGCTCIMLHVF